MLALTLNIFAAGEDRTNAINISSAGTQTLNGVKDANTITWFKIEPEAFGTNNMLTITLGGGNYGYVSIFNDEETDATEDYVIGGSNGLALNPTIKKYHSDAASSSPAQDSSRLRKPSYATRWPSWPRPCRPL